MEQAFIPIAQEMISNGGPEVILQLREPAPTRHSSAAVASVAAPASLSNSTTTNPNAKPCNACRRRKVRCDKSRPCLNCSRLGTACIYDHVVSTTLSGPGGEQSSAGSGIGVIAASNQQILQDRIERLERVIEGMSGLSVRGGSGGRGGGGSGSGGSRHVSPAATATSVSSGYHTMDDADGSGGAGGGGGSSREDHGIQVFEPNMCYYMGPNYWMNLHQFVYEPRYLLRVSGHGAGNRQAADLLLQAGNPALASLPFDMSAMHLSQDQEDLMFDLFFKNVEPFIRIMHRQTFRSDLQDFRTGFSKLEHEMRALVFSIQAVTVAALPSDVVLVTFGQSRHTLMDHFQLATELALSRANYLQSRMIACYQALLYYVTYMFASGQCEKGSMLVGLATRIGMRLGLHRDPRHFNFSPWVSELRRRVWNHLMFLDHPAFNGEGAVSGLDLVSDVQPCVNANDGQWMPAGSAAAPPDADGFTDMTLVIMRSELFANMRRLIKLQKDGTHSDLVRAVEKHKKFMARKFMTGLDENDPMQAMLASYVRSGLTYHQLFSDFVAAKQSKQADMEQQAKLFGECVLFLEERSHGYAIATQNGWGWVFRWPVPWHEIAFLLVGLAHQPNHADVDRAWRQVDESFRRHDNDDFSLGGGAFPAWRAIERLCDQAMHAHPDRNHAGTWYVRRLLDGRQTSPPVPGSRHDSASPKGLFPGSRDGDEDGSLQSDQPSDAVFGDVNMFGSMQSDNMFELSQYFAEPGAVGQFGVTPPEVYSGWNDVSSYRLP